jgi:hypothetical protein
MALFAEARFAGWRAMCETASVTEFVGYRYAAASASAILADHINIGGL